MCAIVTGHNSSFYLKMLCHPKNQISYQLHSSEPPPAPQFWPSKPFVIHSYSLTLMLSESSYSQLQTSVLHDQEKRKHLVEEFMGS